jgi:hypothetical protein
MWVWENKIEAMAWAAAIYIMSMPGYEHFKGYFSN